MNRLRYPTVQLGRARLGQVTDLDIDKLYADLAAVETLYYQLPDFAQEEFAQDLRTCKEASGWAQSTRNLNALFDANSCIEFLRAGFEAVSEASEKGELPEPVTPERVQQEIEGLAVWPWIGVVAGVGILGVAIWAAIR